MDAIAKVLYSGSTTPHNNRGIVIRNLASRLGVDAKELEVVPRLFEQSIEIPLKVSADRNPMRKTIKEVEFFKRNLINLVEDVDARNINSV